MKTASKKKTKKITLIVDDELLGNAMKHTGAGITETVEQGLKWLTAREAFARIRELRGKVKFSRSYAEIKRDRE